MKKLFPIILCVMLIGILALSVSAEGSSVALTPSANTLERGDTFTIVATLTNSDPIKLGTVALEYDANVFELTGGTCHVAGANPAVVLPAQKVGTFMLGAETAVSGQIFTFNFKVKADAAFGTYTFTPTAAIGISTGNKITATNTSITVACNHAYSDWTKLDDNKHQQVCSKCGDEKQDEHDWNDGEGQPSCDQATTVKYTCLICHATKEATINPIGHKYDNDCDTTCNNGCGTTREISHDYVLVNTNSEAHWYECSICDDVKPGSWEKHTPGAEATTDSPQVCTVCDYVIKQVVGHQDVWEEDWTTDSEYHWHRCQTKKCYNVTAKAKHEYDNGCDVDCNTCGYIRVAPHNYKPEWQANAQGHWNICADCNAKSEVLDHIPGPEATMDTPQTCEECNFIIKRELSHEHNFGDKWFSDDENHWQSCGECYEATEMEPHQWDEGVELDDGKMQYTCSICQKQVVTDGEQPSTVPSTQTPPTQKPAESKNSNAFPWQWAGIAAVILLIVGVVLLVIEFIRSRKTNMHGKYSK